MFTFDVSLSIARKAVDDLPDDGGPFMRAEMARLGHTAEDLAPHWGAHVVSAIATTAHRARHAGHEPKPDGTASDRFTVIKDGAFVPEVAMCIENNTCYIGADRPVMRDLAKELLEYLRKNGLPTLAEGAPVTQLALEGDTLIAYVRPYAAPPRDPNWVRATEIKT